MTRIKLLGAVALLVVMVATAGRGRGAGTWTRTAPLLSSRTEVTGAELGGRLYVVGGFGQGGDQVEAYDPRADRWERRAPLPVPIHHTAAVAIAGRLDVVGGYAEGQWAVLDSVFEYDPGTDRWRTRAPLPTARGALAAAVIDGRLYAAGGVGATGRNTDALESTSPARIAGSLARRCQSPAIIMRRPRAAGSLDGSYARNLDAHHVYDPATNRWTAEPPLPTVRSGIAAAVLGPRLFVFGGEAPTGTFGQVEVYDTALSRWSALAPMPTPRHGLTAIAFEGRIHVLSGGPHPGGSYSAVHEVLSP